MRDDTIDRVYGHIPRNTPNVLAPLERGSPLHVFMVRVDWMFAGAIAGLALALLWPN